MDRHILDIDIHDIHAYTEVRTHVYPCIDAAPSEPASAMLTDVACNRRPQLSPAVRIFLEDDFVELVCGVILPLMGWKPQMITC